MNELIEADDLMIVPTNTAVFIRDLIFVDTYQISGHTFFLFKFDPFWEFPLNTDMKKTKIHRLSRRLKLSFKLSRRPEI